MRCNYCTYPAIEGRRVRSRSPERVVDEWEQILRERPGVEHIFVVDAVFNHPPSHARAVCDALIARGNALPWTCYANPLGFDARLAAKMAAAGCAGMEIGADSGCDDVLGWLAKGFTTAHIREVHQVAVDAGLKDCYTFMLGTPGETLDHVRRTLDFVVDMDPFGAILMVWVDDEGALDHEMAARHRGFREQVEELLREHSQRFPRWIIPQAGTNFTPRLFEALRRRGLVGPLWQHVTMRAPRLTAPARV